MYSRERLLSGIEPTNPPRRRFVSEVPRADVEMVVDPMEEGVRIETDRLLIRSFEDGDAAAYADVVADPDVMRFLGGPHGAERAHSYVAECIDRDRISGVSRYAVAHGQSGDFLGYCGYKAITDDPGGPWVDFGWCYRKSVWRQGFGIEAARAVYEYGDRLDLARVEARAHKENAGSLRIIELLGFRWLEDYETSAGTFRRYVDGRCEDDPTLGPNTA